MKKKKKVILGAMAVAVAVPAMVIPMGDNVHANVAADFTYKTLADGTIEITKYINTGIKTVVIPQIIEGKRVTSIGNSAFKDIELTSVVIPKGVTSIASYAFMGSKLTSVTLPEGLTSIGSHTFYGNQLTNVTLPKDLTSIGSNMFSSNQLTNITIPESVKTIGMHAFSANKLTNVTIPGGVTTIGSQAFSENQLISVTLPTSLTTIETQAFYDNQLTDLTIPEGVTTIGQLAFANNQLVSVKFPDSIKTIGQGSFNTNKLTRVVIPSGATIVDGKVGSTGGGAFGVFENNNITELILKDGVAYIGQRAFLNNKIETLIIPFSVTSVGSEAFKTNTLNSVAIGGSSTTIGANAFAGNQANAAELTIKGYDPSTAKTYANSKYHTFNNVIPSDLDQTPAVDPELPTTPTENWSFTNTEAKNMYGVPHITLSGGKTVADIKMKKFNWVDTPTTVTTSEGDILLTPDGDGNTLVSVPSSLGTKTTSTTLEIEHEGTNFLDITIKPTPEIKFNFGN